jgi:hypothetical protein
MDALETVKGLAAFAARAPGSDAERRAARWLAKRLRDANRETETETQWVRPQWPVVYAFHVALAIAGSVVSVDQPAIGAGILGATLVSCALDVAGRAYLLRRLTPRRATQNVIAPAPAASGATTDGPLRLVISAHYDVGRSGLVYRAGVQRTYARLMRPARGHAPGGLGLMLWGMALVTAAAVAHAAGVSGTVPRIVQLIATVGLMIGLALLIDIALSQPVPGANDPASGAAVALALAAALDHSPPANLGVEVVLAGAGEGPALGMRAYVRARRKRLAREATAVIHLAACGRGRPRWWASDGVVPPLRFHPRLLELCAEVARDEGHLGAGPHVGHGVSGAYPARAARFPAVTIGCLDADGLVPSSHQHADVPDRVEPEALRAALEFCLALVDRLDADVARRRRS